MDFFKGYNFKISEVLKVVGFSLAGIIIISIAFRLVSTSFSSMFNKFGLNNIVYQTAPSYDYAVSSAVSEKYSGGSEIGLSVRNVVTPGAPSIMPSPIYGGGPTGDTAEEFEVTTYSATIETRKLSENCAVVSGLKALDYVIFENANEYDRGCNYVFKVKHGNVEEVLGIIKGLEPKELSENTYTIKKLVDDYTGKIEILKTKLASIDQTLAKAVVAYDGVTALATSVRDVESLAKIIDSKINIIERLTQERININSEIERIGRSKAEQLDRLEYTFFNINIYENKFIDGESLKDSWKAEIKDFVREINEIAQDVTINLVVVLLFILQGLIYLIILLVVAKYGWQFAKYIWTK